LQNYLVKTIKNFSFEIFNIREWRDFQLETSAQFRLCMAVHGKFYLLTSKLRDLEND